VQKIILSKINIEIKDILFQIFKIYPKKLRKKKRRKKIRWKKGRKERREGRKEGKNK
jgi:hypothetical protein